MIAKIKPKPAPWFSFSGDHDSPRRLLLEAAGVLLVAVLIAFQWVGSLVEERIAAERVVAIDTARSGVARLQLNINHALSATSALAALVRQGGGQVAHFEAVGAEILKLYPGVGAVQLAPNGVVRRVVPLAGNEKVLGHDLLADPQSTKEAFMARDTGILTLAGPFNLMQGGLGAVGRLPVFLPDAAGQPAFWGFTSVLIRFPDLLDTAGFADIERQGYHWVLWRTHPDTGQRQVIAASGADNLLAPAAFAMTVPNGEWTFSIAPGAGWGDGPYQRNALALGVLISVLVALLFAMLRHYPMRLRAEVAQRTRGESEDALRTAATAFEAQQAQIDVLAFYDPLTQLPNRRLLLDRLEHALHASTRHARKSALLFVDLDNFKALNGTLVHHQGDQLLQQVAQRLNACSREGDTVAHLGSDEFVVMLEELSEDTHEAANQAETVGNNLLVALAREYTLVRGTHHSTASIGITLFGGAQLERNVEPLKRAELAMFQAKAAGRNTLRFFDAQMQAEVCAHVALEADLREAVQMQQFVLHYQPQVVGANHITGVEALVRWQHPLHGMVSPAEFIPLAEETGLILPIGQWVLETACTQLAQWSRQPELAHLTMAVNVSARQFSYPDFVDQVMAVLEHTQAKPKLLKLELTESILADDVEAIIEKMAVLKAFGVGFSLDDFGTGYSSLTYLKRLPLDQLKIDQGFVRSIATDSNDAAIAKMVVVLAESLGLSVIAEGVELQSQADLLAQLGCHAYQGYLFSRTLPLAAFEAFARQAHETTP